MNVRALSRAVSGTQFAIRERSHGLTPVRPPARDVFTAYGLVCAAVAPKAVSVAVQFASASSAASTTFSWRSPMVPNRGWAVCPQLALHAVEFTRQPTRRRGR